MRTANYVQETTVSIAGTNGDGAVTTTAIANTPRVSTVLGAAKVDVRYTIQDVVNNKMEAGIGSMTANVLTRSRPQITWDGTTYRDGSTGAVSPLQFGSTPTAGNIIIRIGPVAEVQAPVMPGRQSTIAGDGTWRDYPLSAAVVNWGGNGFTGALIANNEYYTLYKLDTAGLLNGIQLSVMAAGGTTIKAALYSVGSNGLPGAKILDFAGFSSATTGVKADTGAASWSTGGPVWLTPGWYAIGYICDGAPTILGTLGTNSVSPTPLGRKNAYGYSAGLTVAGNYANGLPTTPNLGSATMLDPGGTPLACPWIGLKVVA